MATIDQAGQRGHTVVRRRRGRGFLALTIVTLLVVDAVAVVGMTVPIGEWIDEWRGEASEPSLIAHSVDVAADAGTARVSLSFHVESPEPLPDDLAGSFGGEGVIRFEPFAMQMTVSFAGLPDAPADAEMEFRMLDTVMFMRMPGFQEETGFATEWMSLDLGVLTGDLDAQELFGTDLTGGNPAQQLEYLRGASDEFEELGTEEVRGVAATRYRVEIDLRDAVDEAPESARPLVRQGVEQWESDFGTTRMPVEVWIDDDGLPRRMRFELPATDMPGAPPGTVVVIEQDMYDYGIPVEVEAPPDDDVVDFTDIVRQGLQLDG